MNGYGKNTGSTRRARRDRTCARRRAATAAVLAAAVTCSAVASSRTQRPMERHRGDQGDGRGSGGRTARRRHPRVRSEHPREHARSRRRSASSPTCARPNRATCPLVLRDTLEGTGQWGQVRVLPANGTGMDLFVDGKILESTGRELKLAITVRCHGPRVAQKVYARCSRYCARTRSDRKAQGPLREHLQHAGQRPARRASTR